MIARIRPRPFAADPLIAEANGRTRRRRLWVGVAALIVVVAAGLTSTLYPRAVTDGGKSRPTAQPGLIAGMSFSRPFEIRPRVVALTGDGSGFLGGFDGNGRPAKTIGWRLGHFSWSAWTPQEAVGTGAVWVRTCWSVKQVERGCMVNHRFTAYRARARAFAPVNGHFTRLVVYSRYGRREVSSWCLVADGPMWQSASNRRCSP